MSAKLEVIKSRSQTFIDFITHLCNTYFFRIRQNNNRASYFYSQSTHYESVKGTEVLCCNKRYRRSRHYTKSFLINAFVCTEDVLRQGLISFADTHQTRPCFMVSFSVITRATKSRKRLHCPSFRWRRLQNICMQTHDYYNKCLLINSDLVRKMFLTSALPTRFKCISSPSR